MVSVADQAFSVPRITTERLVLRAAEPRDLDAYAAHMSDADAVKHMGGAVDRRAAWRLLLMNSGSWIVTGSGWWMLEERASRQVVGMVGAFFRETNLGRGEEADLELGWSVYRPFWKRGFAREAAAAALAWSLERHQPARAIAHIESGNTRSVAVARALNMAHLGQTDFYGETLDLYALDRQRTGEDGFTACTPPGSCATES